MSSAPAFQLYVPDFLSDHLVDAMEPEELGGYFRLLLIAWQQQDRGYLPSDQAKLARWSKLGRRWKKHGPAILACFRVSDDGRLYQKRMVEVAREQEEYREKQRQKGLLSAEARRLKALEGELEEDSRRPTTVHQRLLSGSSTVAARHEPGSNPPSPSPSPPPVEEPEEDLSRAPARVAGDGPKTVARNTMSQAWSSAGLPGLPDASALSQLQVNLFALSLEPAAACATWKSILDVWRERRGVVVTKVTPAKMLEHLPLVQQVLKGEVSLDDIGKQPPAGKGGKKHVGFSKIDDEVHVEGDLTHLLRKGSR